MVEAPMWPGWASRTSQQNRSAIVSQQLTSLLAQPGPTAQAPEPPSDESLSAQAPEPIGRVGWGPYEEGMVESLIVTPLSQQ